MATMSAPTLASETVMELWGHDIRNTLLMAWITMIVLIVIAIIGKAKGYKMIPGRTQSAFDLVIEGLFDFFDSVLQDRKMTRRIFPLVATFFLFIIVANWLGIVPGVGSITVLSSHDGHMMNLPLLRSMNADVNITLALSLISVVMTQYFAIRSIGALPHLGKYFIAPWKSPVGFFVGLLELIGEFTRLISFTFRLFGNIFAGEVLLVVVSFLMPYALPIPFLGLELFVGFIQALVFSLLTLAFIKISSSHNSDHSSSVAHS